MFTQCPHCSTNFSISDEDLTTAGGKVRCGKCGDLFNALYTLSKHPLSNSEPFEVLQISSIDRLSSDTVAASYQLAESGEAGRVPAPSGHTSSLKWGLLGLLLCALLFAQASYFKSNKLAQSYPVLRPFLEQFCALTQCELALQRAPDKVTIISRDVRSHPTIPGALLINITLQNGADFPQSYPRLKLSFFDLNHRQLASRTFLAHEYLPPEIDAQAGFPAGRQLSAALELIDPDKQALNFEFEFK